MIAGRPFRGRLPVPEVRGDPAAGRAGPLKTNIPQILNRIRLTGLLGFLLRLFLPALHLSLDLAHLVLLGLDVRLVTGDLVLGGGNFRIVGGELRLLVSQKLLDRSLLGFCGVLKRHQLHMFLFQSGLPLRHGLLGLPVFLQHIPVVLRDLTHILRPV